MVLDAARPESLRSTHTRQNASAAPNPLRRRILQQSGLQLLSKSATAGSAALSVVVLTRYLGPSGFGGYVYISGVITLMSGLLDLGPLTIAVRDIARQPWRGGLVAGHAMAVSALLALVTLGIGLPLLLLVPHTAPSAPGLHLAIVVAGLGLLSVPCTIGARALFQAHVRMKVPSTVNALSSILLLGLVALLARGTPGALSGSGAVRLVGVIAAGTFASWCGAAVTYLAARRLGRLRVTLRGAALGTLLRDSIGLTLVNFISVIHYRIDVLILGLMTSMVTIGQYGVATRFVDVAFSVTSAFMALAFPVLSARIGEDATTVQRTFQRTLDCVLILGVGFGVFCSFLAPTLIRLFAGDAFRSAETPVAILAWGIPIMLANMVLVYMLIAANRQSLALPSAACAVAINVTLNLALIPRFGASGPAIATDISETVNALMVGVLVARHYQFHPSLSSAVKVGVAGAAAALSFLALRADPALAAAVAAVAYVAVLWSTRLVTMADMLLILPSGRA